jgi:recombination associated protein RdgC
MPILSGTVTFARFRVEPAESFPTDVRRWLSRGLRARGFEPIEKQSDEERAAGAPAFCRKRSIERLR